MALPRHTAARSGHTLVELITATVSSVVLLAGLGGVMLIARQIAYTPTASTRQLEASHAVRQLADELRFATWIATPSVTAIEFAVVDRDGDGVAERIRYEWSGTPGDPLERTYNGGTAVPIVDSVESFQLTYATDDETVQLTPLSESAEALLLANETVGGSNERMIDSSLWVSQQINAGALASVPAGAVSWNATRVNFCGRSNGVGDTLLVQLRSAGNPYYGPTSEALGTISIPETSLTSSAPPNNWNSSGYSFTSPIRGLQLTGRYSLVWACSTGGTACRLNYIDSIASGVAESTDSGASWQYMSSRQVNYRLYGTYTTAGTPVDVTRSYVSAVLVNLQPGGETHSRIDTSIPLSNRPELTSAVWRADFDADPTAIDIDGNGTFDWEVNGGGSFDEDSLSEGIWTVDVPLESRPRNDFSGVTYVDAQCQNGAVLRINADRSGGTHGPLIVRVTSASGVQTLTLTGETAANTEKTLATVERLASGWVRFRLLIVPSQNIVQLQVQDREVGTYVYPTYSTTTTDRFISLSGVGSQFDYVEARISSAAVVELAN